MLKKLLLVTVATVLGACSAFFNQQEQETIQQTPSTFMEKKLDYSREIVAGLATEDFDQIGKAAQNMMLLSQEADWKVITTPEYLKASSSFRDAAARLRDISHEKNLDGATLAYFEVTLNCVRCHKQLRLQPPTHSK